MIVTLLSVFTLLLLTGMPIAVLLAVTTAVALAVHTSTPLLMIPQQLFNALDNFVLLAIPFFILAGGIMSEGAISRRLVAIINVLVGSFRGGTAIAGVIACIFFAALSGSSPATVIAIGSVMIPALVKAGYKENFSIGLITSAGSLGIVIPPSIPMILYCMVMNVSVAELFMAGVGPGLLIGLVLIGYTYFMAVRHNWRHRRRYTSREVLHTVREGIWALLLPVVVLGGIYSGIFTPTEAAAVSVVYALAVELVIYRELTLRRLFKVCRDAAVLSSCLLFILSCAMTFLWLLTSEGIPAQVAGAVMNVTDTWWKFLLAVNLLFLVMGMFMDDVSAMLILSPLFAETLRQFHIDLVHYGIIMVLAIEFGFLTPPFGLNLFVAMGLTGKSLLYVARAVLPFLFLLLFCMLLVNFIPKLSLFLPSLLLR